MNKLKRIKDKIDEIVDKGKYSDSYGCAWRDGNNNACNAIKKFIEQIEEENKSAPMAERPEIMPRPAWMNDEDDRRSVRLKKSYMSGGCVLGHFWDQGIWHENHIPKELKESGWKPEVKVMYRCWWHSTNPADVSDPGVDILDYIEQVG